ncbi:MAG: hypothetical protein ACRD2G_16370 [Terriglobia bacterium]
MLRTLLYLLIGVALLYTPWVPLWTNNFFVVHYTWVAVIAQNDYVRGAISGVGLADVWLAYEELMRLVHSVEKEG